MNSEFCKIFKTTWFFSKKICFVWCYHLGEGSTNSIMWYGVCSWKSPSSPPFLMLLSQLGNSSIFNLSSVPFCKQFVNFFKLSSSYIWQNFCTKAFNLGENTFQTLVHKEKLVQLTLLLKTSATQHTYQKIIQVPTSFGLSDNLKLNYISKWYSTHY